MATAKQVVDIALAEIGYKEKASNKDLDIATANAGTGNWTKYARDLWNAGYYNGNKNGYAWCDVFVDWCFYKAFGKTEGQLIECQTGDLGASCPYSAGYYKAQGRYDTTPKVGDQVFFQQGGDLCHTGLVVEVTSSQVITVEGNTSDMVAKRTYNRTSTYIAGYGHPKYDGTEITPAEAPSQTTTETTATTETADKTESNLGTIVTVYVNTVKYGSVGAQVKTVQRILSSRGITDNAGAKIEVDGQFGNSTKQAVIKLQKQLFPQNPSEWDGIVGVKMWSAMLKSLW